MAQRQAGTGHNSTAASAALYERALRVMPGGSTRATVYWPPHPPYAVEGKGCRIIDADGNAYLDFSNNFFSVIHGHAHPEIVAAVQKEAAKGMAFGLPTERDLELAEALTARLPAAEQIRFCNSGTEAVMHAIKAARAYTGRHRIAKMEGGYHGSYDPIEVGFDCKPLNWGEASRPNSTAYLPGTPPSLLEDVLVLPFNDLAACEVLIAEHAKTLAAVMLDVLPARIGMIPATAEFATGLQACCRRHGVLLIMDEIVTFRLHHGGAHERFGLRPDVLTLGKVIGGGQPVGAIAGSRDVMQVFDGHKGRAKVPQGGTFSANPLTMAAGLAAVRLLNEPALADLETLGQRLCAGAANICARAPAPWQITGLGSLFRIHPHTRSIRNFRDSYAQPDEAERLGKLFGFFLAHGVLITPNCAGALCTPMTEADVDEFLGILEAGLRSIGAA
ncbi:MAG: aspartate aminotransferase family protein [Mesorhizobium sp.]